MFQGWCERIGQKLLNLIPTGIHSVYGQEGIFEVFNDSSFITLIHSIGTRVVRVGRVSVSVGHHGTV